MSYLDLCEKMINHPNPFNMGVEEANALRLAAIQGSFEHHYKNNAVYRAFCNQFGVEPDEIRTFDDIPKIALITSDFFKQISAYKEENLARIISVPQAEIVTYFTTSGTTGKPSKYPFNKDSLIRLNKSNAQILKCIGDVRENDKYMFLTPDLKHTPTGLVHGMYQSIEAYIGKGRAMDQIRFAMGTDEDGKTYYKLDGILSFIAGGGVVHLFGPPFAYKDIAEMLIKNKATVKLGEHSKAFSSGGWKGRKEGMITPRELNNLIHEAYGIEEANIRDGLGLTDIFSWMLECECKKKHVPPWMHVSARKESDSLKDLEQIMPKNREGILAFLTPIVDSYPAFITTGDLGALTTNYDEKCECGRLGPTVEYRGRSGDPRGCALVELEKMQTSAFILVEEGTGVSKNQSARREVKNSYEGHSLTKIE